MKIFKNRIFLSILCIMIAGIVTFVFIPKLYKDKGVTVTVLRAAEDIPKGVKIESKDVAEVETGRFGLPDNLINDKTLVIGKIAKTDISKGDYIFPGKIVDFVSDERMDRITKENKRLVTVSVQSIAAGLSSLLGSGDFATVAVFLDQKQDNEGKSMPAKVVIQPELRGLEVYSVENSRTQSTEQQRKQQQADNKTSSYDTIPKAITLIVTEAQAAKLIEAEYTGKIHIIFEKRGKNYDGQ